MNSADRKAAAESERNKVGGRVAQVELYQQWARAVFPHLRAQPKPSQQ